MASLVFHISTWKIWRVKHRNDWTSFRYFKLSNLFTKPLFCFSFQCTFLLLTSAWLFSNHLSLQFSLNYEHESLIIVSCFLIRLFVKIKAFKALSELERHVGASFIWDNNQFPQQQETVLSPSWQSGTTTKNKNAHTQLSFQITFFFNAHCCALLPAGEVLPPAESSGREGGGVQSSVPHLHCSRGPAVVWQDRAGLGLLRYENTALSGFSGEHAE